MQLDVVTKAELHAMLKEQLEAFAALLKDEKTINAKTKVYSENEICEHLKVCKKSMANFRNRAMIRYTQIGRKIIYSQHDVDTFLETYKQKTFIEQLRTKKHE